MSILITGTEDARQVAAALRSYLKQLDVVAGDKADVDNLEQVVADLERGLPAEKAVRKMKADMVCQLLRSLLLKYSGNVSAVARQAGCDRKQLHVYMKRFGLDPATFRPDAERRRVLTAAKRRARTIARKRSNG